VSAETFAASLRDTVSAMRIGPQYEIGDAIRSKIA
jgi:hypothetical protein